MKDALQCPSLFKAYEKHFRIGAAVSSFMTLDPAYRSLIRRHFNSLTADNQMKPESVLDRSATLAKGDLLHAAVDFTRVDALMYFARDNGIAMRYHTLAWHNQTPRWFFSKDWSDAEGAEPASKETMLTRLENYILDVMNHVNSKFPDLVYTWDVVNEAIEPENKAPGLYRTRSPWYQTCGEDFLPAAFRAARKGQVSGQTLCYNDYNAFDPVKRNAIIDLLKKLQAENLVDTMGMQGHYVADWMNVSLCEEAARAYAALDLKLQVTELDIHSNSDDEAHNRQLARLYGDYFAMLKKLKEEGVDIEAVTFWGVTDQDSWLIGFRKETSYPLLFDRAKQAKDAYDAVMKAAE